MSENPYRRPELQAAWERGRRAGEREEREREQGTWQAFRRGFNSGRYELAQAHYEKWLKKAHPRKEVA